MAKTMLQKSAILGAVTALFVSLVPSSSVLAADDALRNGPTDIKELQTFADQMLSEEQLKKIGVPGATLVVVKDDKVLLQKGYGYANAEKKQPVDPENTLFRLASISKVFTATGVMQLAEQGKVDLNGDINQYLGDLQFTSNFGTPVTVANLLTHSTGFEIRDPRPTDIHFDLNTVYPLEQYAKETAPPVIRKPGEAFMYDNYASMLQGLIVQNVSGTPFHSYAENNIFKPLGMKDSSFLLSKAAQEKLAVGYVNGQPMPIYAINPTDLPQGGMVSTGSDMAKFLIASLNNGTYNGTQILKPDTLKDMQTYHHFAHPKVPNMAYGWESSMFPDNGEYVIAKGGNVPGFSSYMWLLPEDKIGVYAIANGDGGAFQEKVFTEFMNHYYPKKATDKYLTTPKKDLARFEGFYDDLRVAARHTKVTATGDGELLVTDPAFGAKGKLRQVDDLIFEDEKGNYMTFIEENGTLKYLRYLNLGYSKKLDAANGYKDVAADHPYASYIHDLQVIGIMTGDSEGKFEPASPVTRAEFVSTLMRGLSLPIVPESPNPFTDVSDDHWAADAIKLMSAYGLVAGTTPTTFEPAKTITRQEAAAIVSRALKLSGVQPLEAQLAGETDPWAVEGVKMIVAIGAFGPEVQAQPNAPVDYKSKQLMKRQEIAAMMAKIIIPE